MAVVHEKIRAAIRDRKLSMRAAASLCNVNYRTLHSALNDERDVSHSLLQRISDGLDIDFGYFGDFAPIIVLEETRDRTRAVDNALRAAKVSFDRTCRTAAYSGNGVTLQSFLNWWCSTSGRLENIEQIASKVDIFDPPNIETGLIQPLCIGQESLATKSFASKHVDHLKQTLLGFSKSCNEKLLQAHLEALKRGEPVITHPVLDEKLRDGRRFSRQYRRVLAPVTAAGRILVINYSEDIG